MIIKEVYAKIIKDSRNNETISVSVNGCDEASSPNGKSVGDYETPSHYKSLNFCVKFLNNWKEFIEIEKFEDLIKIEKEICRKLKLKNAREFGANSLYAFESAILKALAHENGKELFEIVGDNRRLPNPVGNVIGGGLHSSQLKERPNFQEFLVIPFSKPSENVKIMDFIHTEIGKSLKTKKVNDEGALLVSISDSEALEILSEIKKIAEKRFHCKIAVGIDAATSTLFNKNHYKYHNHSHNKESQLIHMQQIISSFNLYYLEDPFEQHDFVSFSKLTKKFGNKCLIVGDDLIATQYNRLVGAIRTKSINAVIIKPNQNGSLLELKRIFDLCKKHKIKTIMSHRSGETLDSGLADYAVGFGADYIKCGVKTKWREAKLKRLIEIEKIARNM